MINILDFNLIKENDKFHNVFLVKEREDNFVFTDDLEIHYLELNKFKENKEVEKLNDLEEWITFLKECSPDGDMKVVDKLSQNKEEISVAVDIMNKLSADEMEYQRYLAREKYLMDEMSKKKYAEYKMNKVREELEAAEKERDRVKEEKNKVEKEKNKIEEEKNRVEEQRNREEQARVKAENEKEQAEKAKQAIQAEKEAVEAKQVLLTQKAKMTVIKLLKSRFEELPVAYEQRIMELSSETIATIMGDIFELERIEDIDKYIKL